MGPLIASYFVATGAGQLFGQEPTAGAPAVSHAYTPSGIFKDDDRLNPVDADRAVSGVEAASKLPDTLSYQPLTVREKFLRSTKGIFGPVALAFDALGAGYGQLTNSPGPWRQGSEAYGKRFASAFGVNFANQYSDFALAAALHQDPRYYPSVDRSYKARIKNALKQAFIAKTDSGGSQFAYAKIGGALAGGFAPNAWLPGTDNKIGDGFETAGVLLALNTACNLAQEFVPMFRHVQ